MNAAVPTGPGRWYHGGEIVDAYWSSRRKGASMWAHPIAGGEAFRVTDDGLWLCPVPTPDDIAARDAEVAGLRAELAGLREKADASFSHGFLVAAPNVAHMGEDSIAEELLRANGIRTQEDLAAESGRVGLDGVDENRLMSLVEVSDG